VKKPLTAEQITAAAWAAGLATPKEIDEVPPEWLTTRQIAKQIGKAMPTTGALLNRAVAEGRAERKLFRVTTGSVTRPIPHYRLKP
jgi:hypothetical protein